MDNQIINFCELIKHIIHPNEEYHLQGEVDWSYLVQLSKDHNLLPLFMEGASKHFSYLSRSEYDQESKECLAVVAGQVRRTSAFLMLYEAFINEGVHPIVMKGLICRKLYGKLADHRPSGDEDILIPPSEFTRARDVLVANGYLSELDVTTESQLEWLQEVSFIHPKEKLHIELHLNPMGRENDARSRMSDYFANVFEDYREDDFDGITVRTMNYQDHLVFLILHALKHFMSGGFGIRQVLDILLYQKQYGEKLNLEHVYEILREFRADVFWTDLIHIGNSYFGFKEKVLGKPNCPQELLEDMIRCGTFGNKTKAERIAGRTVILTTGNYLNDKKSNSLIRVWQSIFPNKGYLRDKYPYLDEKPWLLPLAWLQRWGRILKRSHNSNSGAPAESMKISRRRIKLLKRYNLA